MNPKLDPHLISLFVLLAAVTACKYLKIEPDQMILGAILLALKVAPDPQKPAEPPKP